MIPGVLSKEESVMEESIYSGLLEYFQYTQPRSYEGMDVPDVLIPSSVKDMSYTFENCDSLTGKLMVMSNASTEVADASEIE